MSQNKAILSWGKCTVACTPVANSGASGSGGTFPTPIEGSTQLTTNKGDKVEAVVEGGANEAVRYKVNTYTLELECRRAKGRTFPVTDTDGVVSGLYSVTVTPEDASAPVLTLNAAVCSVEDSFDTTDGGKVKFVFDTVKPESGNQITWADGSAGAGT